MNKILPLISGVLLTASVVQAQWVTQPIGFPDPVAAPYFIKAVDANTVWATGYNLLDDSSSDFARSTNGGVTWTTGTVTGVNANTGIVTAITAVDGNTAWVTVWGITSGILKTTDGGATWVRQGTAFSSDDSYPNLIHFFNANDGVAQGDPLTEGGSFEVYTTSNGGATWTPVTTPASLPDEYGVEATPAFSGDNIWFATSADGDNGRVYHSTNKGLTWTVANAALPFGFFSLAFRDAQNGLVSVLDENAESVLKRTSDGGATWAEVNYTGEYSGFGLDNVPGTQQYISTGFFGSSYSRDNGQTWVALESTRSHLRVDAVSPTAAWSGALDVDTFEGLGMHRLSTAVLGSRAASPEQAGFRVYPNPSADGRFVLAAKQAQKSTALHVVDALGRTVTRHTWQGTNPFTLDLSKYKAGVYTLEINSETGVSRQKLVVQ